jgi:hypothetical protein
LSFSLSALTFYLFFICMRPFCPRSSFSFHPSCLPCVTFIILNN